MASDEQRRVARMRATFTPEPGELSAAEVQVARARSAAVLARLRAGAEVQAQAEERPRRVPRRGAKG